MRTTVLMLCCLTASGWLSLAGAQGLDRAALKSLNSRAELESRLESADLVARSDDYSLEERAVARVEAASIRQRLRDGDFVEGDAIKLTVTGYEELTGTFTLAAGRVIHLPKIGPMSLTGVLRSELETYLTQELSRYVVNPQVRARTLIRLSLDGQVPKPGFYIFPPEMSLADALMQQGFAEGADLAKPKLKITRRSETLMEGDPLRTAILQGRSLADLGLQTGDVITVGQRPQAVQAKTQIAVLVISSVLTLGLTSLLIR